MEAIKGRLGRNIEQFRKRIKLSREALAEHCNVSPGTVGNWERGERWPEYENIHAIAELLGIDEAALFAAEITPISPTPGEALQLVADHIKALEARIRALEAQPRPQVQNSLIAELLRRLPNDVDGAEMSILFNDVDTILKSRGMTNSQLSIYLHKKQTG